MASETTTATVRPCNHGTYRCATFGCDRWAVEVETVPVEAPGLPRSVAFYGACDEHRKVGQ